MRLALHPTLKKIGVGILDTLFPIRCLSCGTYGQYLCEGCLVHFPRRLQQRCPTCRRSITPRGEVCFSCTGKQCLDGLFAGSTYRDSLVAESIHTCKYRFIPALAEPLGRWLAERILESDLPLPDMFIPVPLHKRRLRFRGFNQSQLLAQTLAETLTPGNAIPVLSDILVRARFTKSQIKTKNREERLHNLRNAFVITPEHTARVAGKTVWIIDDVATTGTTLEECARVLKSAGAKSVFGIVLAR